MRLHRHQVGRVSRWHSVRVYHRDIWDWCAHHEEVECHQRQSRRFAPVIRVRQSLKLHAVH